MIPASDIPCALFFANTNSEVQGERQPGNREEQLASIIRERIEPGGRFGSSEGRRKRRNGIKEGRGRYKRDLVRD